MAESARRLLRVFLVLWLALLLVSAVAPVAVAEPGDNVPGPLASDQTPPTSTQPGTIEPVASAVPMTPFGPAPNGTYATATDTGSELDSSTDLRVVTSTLPGTSALSGLVLSAATGSPVASAAVSLALPRACGLPTRMVHTTTSTSDGAFAFVDIDPRAYTFIVHAHGYGLYALTNDGYNADTEYVRTVKLTATSQTGDESPTVAGSPAGGSFSAATGCARSGEGPAATPYELFAFELGVLEVGGASYHRLGWDPFSTTRSR